MKVLRITFIILLAGAVTFGLSGMAQAFHGGGVAHCDGCHTMHNSLENPAAGDTNNQLLKGSDASSTCLNCHNGAARYHINSADGSNTNQGGDFYWVSNPYTVLVRGTVRTFGGDNAGHNVIAADFSMLQDANLDNATAPGGTYPAVELGCHSCHDPHGKVAGGTAGGGAPISVSGSYGAADPTDGSIHGNYRLLGDSSYVAPGGVAFTADAPVATADSYDGHSVFYGSGMSEWCANCHTDYINDSHKHPSGDGEHLNGYGDNYNSYVATGDFTGLQATAYDALVPFEKGVTDGSDPSLLNANLTGNTTEGSEGTTTSSNVMCLTCHRAHASAHNNAGKWDFEVELLAESHALESADVPIAAAVYYKDGAEIDIVADYGAFQRSLCNKCHVQD